MDTFAVIGLGYVGLRVATSLAAYQFNVIGYDISEKRIGELKDNIDHNLDISSEQLSDVNIEYTSNAKELSRANFYFVDIDTPINKSHQPDMSALFSACDTLGNYLKQNDIIVFESTIFPGATEELLIPILEKQSGLIHEKDFFVGYSPERVVPGDSAHNLNNTAKIIAATDTNTINKLKAVYEKILDAPIYIAPSIKVAEMAKLLENIQRDVNIALVNEMAMFADKLNISMKDVIDAASTKWNFQYFQPGFVGGHCIPVDPYYFIYKSETIGTPTRLIENARLVNDSMIGFIKQIINKHHKLGKNTLVMGLSFKENIADTRNSLAIKLYETLGIENHNIELFDPIAYIRPGHQDTLSLKKWNELSQFEVVIITVGHNAFKSLGFQEIIEKLTGNGLLIDIPGIFRAEGKEVTDKHYWSF